MKLSKEYKVMGAENGWIVLVFSRINPNPKTYVFDDLDLVASFFHKEFQKEQHGEENENA